MAGTEQEDSLAQTALNLELSDSTRLEAYKRLLIWHYIYDRPDTAYDIAQSAAELANSAELRKFEALFISLQAFSLDRRGLKQEAFELHQKALKIREEIDDRVGMCNSLINLGMIYMDLTEYQMALDVTNKAYRIYREEGKESGEADAISNLAIIHLESGNTNIAVEFFEQGLEYYEIVKDTQGISNSLTNAGIAYRRLGNTEKALDNYKRGLRIRRKIGDSLGVANSYANLAAIYNENLGELDKAAKYAQRALNTALNIGDPFKIISPSETLYQIYKKQGDYKKALEMYQLSKQMGDSLHNMDLKNKVAIERTRAEYQRQQLLKAQKEKEKRQKEEEAQSRRNTLQYSALLIGLLLLFVIVIITGRLDLSTRVAEGLIFLAFLLFFEFLLLLFDPYVEKWTNRAPALMFAINSSIALVIFPFHGFIERLAKRRLIKAKED